MNKIDDQRNYHKFITLAWCDEVKWLGERYGKEIATIAAVHNAKKHHDLFDAIIKHERKEASNGND